MSNVTEALGREKIELSHRSLEAPVDSLSAAVGGLQVQEGGRRPSEAIRTFDVGPVSRTAHIEAFFVIGPRKGEGGEWGEGVAAVVGP